LRLHTIAICHRHTTQSVAAAISQATFCLPRVAWFQTQVGLGQNPHRSDIPISPIFSGFSGLFTLTVAGVMCNIVCVPGLRDPDT